jgi:ParB family chromosome partitioning protein
VVEEAKALIRLQNEFQLTQQEVADMVSKPRSTVTNLMRVIGLENSVLKHLELSKIEMGHAKCLLGLSVELQRQACEKILASNLTVRQTETLVKKFKRETSKVIYKSMQNQVILIFCGYKMNYQKNWGHQL